MGNVCSFWVRVIRKPENPLIPTRFRWLLQITEGQSRKSLSQFLRDVFVQNLADGKRDYNDVSRRKNASIPNKTQVGDMGIDGLRDICKLQEDGKLWRTGRGFQMQRSNCERCRPLN